MRVAHKNRLDKSVIIKRALILLITALLLTVYDVFAQGAMEDVKVGLRATENYME